MFMKFLALFLIIGVCLAVPVEDDKKPEQVPATVGNKQPIVVHPSKPQKPDNSDLQADPSTWWHTYYHHNYPVYHYNVHRVPTYTYWHAHY